MTDVARTAGVSPATVSLVLAGKGRISSATRERVLRAVRDLGYEVNKSARSLRTSKTGAIGLYLPEYAGTLDFYMSLAFGAVEAADQLDQSVVLVPPHLRTPAIAALPVDGFLVIDVDPDDAVVRTILSGTKPVVAGEAVPTSLPAPTMSIEFDHSAAMRTLLGHLWTRGARRIGVLTADINLPWVLDLQQGYDTWAAEHRMEVVRFGITAEMGREGIVAAMDGLLASGIDALITIPDMSAPFAMKLATEAGRTIGGDLLFASYFDGSFSEWMSPSITALDFDPRNFGRLLVRALGQVLAGDTVVPTVTIPAGDVHLRIRQSSKGQ